MHDKEVSYVVCDVKDFTSSNDKMPVTKISASEIEIAYAETLVYNDATQKATIAMNLNGGNSVTYATEQSPVTITIDEEKLTLWNGDMDGGEVDLTVTTKAGGSSSPWRVASVSDTWFRTIPGVGGPETNASGATLTLDIDANTGDKRVGYFMLESQNTTLQIYIGQRDPYATVTIGGLQWTQYNLANPRQAPGGATFATALPSECTGVRLASHGKFYQCNRNVAWASMGSISGFNTIIPGGTTWESANNPCPDGFVVPTLAHWNALIAACKEDRYNNGSGWSNTNYGYLTLTDKTNSANKLEFPAVGYRYPDASGNLNLRGMHGYYWSSTYHGPSDTETMYFSSSISVSTGHYTRHSAFSVRCVHQ